MIDVRRFEDAYNRAREERERAGDRLSNAQSAFITAALFERRAYQAFADRQAQDMFNNAALKEEA